MACTMWGQCNKVAALGRSWWRSWWGQAGSGRVREHSPYAVPWGGEHGAAWGTGAADLCNWHYVCVARHEAHVAAASLSFVLSYRGLLVGHGWGHA